MRDFNPKGVKGISGVEPIAASLQIGRRERGKVPIEKDRFHLMRPHEEDGRKEPHPSFAFWNNYDRKDPAQVRKRKTIRGVIAHNRWDYAAGGCLQQHLQAWRLNRSATPPPYGPACKGDGVNARRFFGDKGRDDFRIIDCLESCPFRTAAKGSPPCKPLTRFIFRLDWSGTPAAGTASTPLVRFASHSYHTYRSFLGLRESIENAARAVGADPAKVSPFGLRFEMSVQLRTKPGKKFPVVLISPLDSPADFVIQSLTRQNETRGLIADLSDPQQMEADQRYLTVDPQ